MHDHRRNWPGLRLRDYEVPGSRDELAQWCHILDDRTLQLSCISLGNASLDDIARPDWVRLCFVDGASKDVAYPYTERTLGDFEREHCYDRFYDLGTRQLFSGYAFVVVGGGGFFDDIIRNHTGPR